MAATKTVPQLPQSHNSPVELQVPQQASSLFSATASRSAWIVDICFLRTASGQTDAKFGCRVSDMASVAWS